LKKPRVGVGVVIPALGAGGGFVVFPPKRLEVVGLFPPNKEGVLPKRALGPFCNNSILGDYLLSAGLLGADELSLLNKDAVGCAAELSAGVGALEGALLNRLGMVMFFSSSFFYPSALLGKGVANIPVGDLLPKRDPVPAPPNKDFGYSFLLDSAASVSFFCSWPVPKLIVRLGGLTDAGGFGSCSACCFGAPNMLCWPNSPRLPVLAFILLKGSILPVALFSKVGTSFFYGIEPIPPNRLCAFAYELPGWACCYFLPKREGAPDCCPIAPKSEGVPNMLLPWPRLPKSPPDVGLLPPKSGEGAPVPAKSDGGALFLLS
jgi:hypothetical protein